MTRIHILAVSFVLAASATPAWAQDAVPIPPENAKPLSAIVAEIEKRQDFRFIDSVEWEEEGYYEITYHTADKAKVEIKIDAVSGSPRD